MSRVNLNILVAACVFMITLTVQGEVIEEWVRRYDGPGHEIDEARAIAVDDFGNVYVTGISYDPITKYDYATVKYDSYGNQKWVSRHNGLMAWSESAQRYEGSSDNAVAIAVDGSGNIYVTGITYSYYNETSFSADYGTIKYDSNGNELWVRRYNGPEKRFNDYATAITVDSSGNVYVTGESHDDPMIYFFSRAYATIKYDPNGNQLWVARYESMPEYSHNWARAIAVDDSGNTYVTGCIDIWDSNDNADYATVKYGPNGNELWVRKYNGTASVDDGAYAIAVDVSSNIYVTGVSWGLTGGPFPWDYATIKYDSGGNELWVRRYDGPGNGEDWAKAIAVDGSGNVYVTGESQGNISLCDYATIKYDSDGNELWVRRYDEPGNSVDRANAIAVDGSGNVYVTGQSHAYLGLPDYATIKYNSDGNEFWVRRYDGPGNREDLANAIAVDGSGNVYVTGMSWGSDISWWDYATIKYSQRSAADLDGDGDVEFADYSILALAWMSDPNETNWNQICDISDPNDNIIDMHDLDVFTDHWLAGTEQQ